MSPVTSGLKICLWGQKKSVGKHSSTLLINFLTNAERVANYIQLLDKLLTAYKTIKCNMKLKIHFLHSHLDFLPENLGAVSDELRKRFH